MHKVLALIFVIFIAVVGLLIGGWTGAILMGGLALLLALAGATLNAALVRVPEWRVAPIFNREAQRFERFLPPGHYLIKPFVEYAGDMINTGSVTASGTCEDALTLRGIPISLEWSVLYSMDPQSIEFPALRSKMARALPRHSGNIVANHANNTLKHIVNGRPVDYFYGEGAHQELEALFEEQLRERLAILQLTPIRVMIKKIIMPEKVLAALEAAHEYALTVEALTRLHGAIANFSDEDINRLEKLRRLDLLKNSNIVHITSK